MRTLDRAVIAEVGGLYLAGLAAALVVLAGAALVEVLADVLMRGADPILVAQLVALKLPEAFSRGLTLALLFAVLLAMARMASDSEIKALLLHGVAPVRIAAPILAMGVAVSGVALYNQEAIVPSANRSALEVQKDILLRSPRVVLEEGTFFNDGEGRSIFIRRADPDGTLHDIRMIRAFPGGAPEEYLEAATGRLAPDGRSWEFDSGRRLTFEHGRLTSAATFESARLQLRDLQVGGGGVVPAEALGFFELLRRIQQFGREGLPVSSEATALHRKLADPLAALAFAAFGVGAGLYALRVNAGLGVTGVLVLTFMYYAVWSLFGVLGQQGVLPPALAAWAPNLLYAGLGLALMAIAARR